LHRLARKEEEKGKGGGESASISRNVFPRNFLWGNVRKKKKREKKQDSFLITIYPSRPSLCESSPHGRKGGRGGEKKGGKENYIKKFFFTSSFEFVACAHNAAEQDGNERGKEEKGPNSPRDPAPIPGGAR